MIVHSEYETTDPAVGEVKHDHTEPRPGCRCAERHALSRGMTPEESERAREFFVDLTSAIRIVRESS